MISVATIIASAPFYPTWLIIHCRKSLVLASIRCRIRCSSQGCWQDVSKALRAAGVLPFASVRVLYFVCHS